MSFTATLTFEWISVTTSQDKSPTHQFRARSISTVKRANGATRNESIAVEGRVELLQLQVRNRVLGGDIRACIPNDDCVCATTPSWRRRHGSSRGSAQHLTWIDIRTSCVDIGVELAKLGERDLVGISNLGAAPFFASDNVHGRTIDLRRVDTDGLTRDQGGAGVGGIDEWQVVR